MKLTVVWPKFCSWEKEEREERGEQSGGGVTNEYDHPSVTSQTLPNKASMTKQPPDMLSKSAKKLQNSPLPPKNRAEQFPNDLYVSGDMLFCKFCQRTVDWKHEDMCKDHLWSKAHTKNKEKHCAAAANTSRATTALRRPSLPQTNLRREFFRILWLNKSRTLCFILLTN